MAIDPKLTSLAPAVPDFRASARSWTSALAVSIGTWAEAAADEVTAAVQPRRGQSEHSYPHGPPRLRHLEHLSGGLDDVGRPRFLLWCSRGAGGTDATGTSSAASPAGVRGIGMVRKVSGNVLCVSTIFCRDWLEQQWGANLQPLLLRR